jgi:two-component system OmpR family response regulator
MDSGKKILIYIVDDDALFLKSLEIEFSQNNDTAVKTFATGELCMESMSVKPDVIILDYYLNSIDIKAINGLETLDRIKLTHPQIPIIMLSSQDDIEVAVNCMRHKALDYFVKSETAFIRLQKAITDFLHNKKIQETLSWYMDKM